MHSADSRKPLFRSRRNSGTRLAGPDMGILFRPVHRHVRSDGLFRFRPYNGILPFNGSQARSLEESHPACRGSRFLFVHRVSRSLRTRVSNILAERDLARARSLHWWKYLVRDELHRILVRHSVSQSHGCSTVETAASRSSRFLRRFLVPFADLLDQGDFLRLDVRRAGLLSGHVSCRFLSEAVCPSRTLAQSLERPWRALLLRPHGPFRGGNGFARLVASKRCPRLARCPFSFFLFRSFRSVGRFGFLLLLPSVVFQSCNRPDCKIGPRHLSSPHATNTPCVAKVVSECASCGHTVFPCHCKNLAPFPVLPCR